MGAHESELKTIVDQGGWEAPHLGDLRTALTILNSTMGRLAESPGWEGAAAKAAGEQWVELQKAFTLVSDSLGDVQRVNASANASLNRAASAIGALPAGKTPAWLHNAVKTAEVGATVFIPAMGVTVLAAEALGVFDKFLGSQREHEATAARTVLQQELAECATQLQAIPLDSRLWPVPEPQPTPPSGTGGSSPHVAHGGTGGYSSPSYPTYATPTYTEPSGPTGPGYSGPSNPSTFNPRSPNDGGTYHAPSADDGSVGTLPGYNSGGGSGGFGSGGIGAGGIGSGGFSSGGSHSGLNAGVLGGGAAAGAAALRFGIGGGMGGGAGAGGLGGAGVTGTGGLLGAGGSGAGSSGAGGTGGAGAAGNGRGMMGGQTMGGQQMGGANSSKKDKRSGLGGHIAPKIEDNEVDFIPLPDGARAGARDNT